MFSYYSKWIPSFANKVRPLINVKSFPINSEALEAFQFLKRKLHAATLSSIDESLLFVVECDASDVAVSAILSQNGCPVAFMSRTLGKSEINYPSVEKEAVAIIEAIQKWQHLLLRNPFKLITDQRSVAFMFDNRKKTKIKNKEIKRVCSNCQICSKLKPKFYRSSNVFKLIKSIRPMDRLSIDLKGPLPSNSRNKYLFTVIDEYSRYSFAFPCPDISLTTVVNCLDQIFSFCGFPTYIHSDRGSSFISNELKSYLTQKGIATSNSTPYHPINVRNWEIVLSDALYSRRSLLSTATNCTPHERLFSFPRRSSSGTSLPSWLNPGPIFLRRFVRTNKNDNLVDKVELVDVNPTYANIRYPDGRELTVSLQDLAPYPAPKEKFNDINENSINESSENVTAKVLDVNKDPHLKLHRKSELG
ncbi:uncharacterized protein LOC136093395 [Hydra vulgaris]|uniref:uncharacterized protein LOC136093395 n=1 Tax=Hydra vulgaris TaxID=6087 RepID=UPI0032EA295E